MRVTNLVETSTQRIAVLAALSVLAVAGAATVWAVSGLWLALVTAVLSVVILALAKAVMELSASVVGELEATSKQVQALGDQVRAVEDRARVAEAAAEIQDRHNEAVLDRVRAVETAAGNQEQFNEKVLGRVRAVETAAGNQEQFNEKVLDRVRTVEKAASDQSRSIGISEAVAGTSFHNVRRVISPDEVSEIMRVSNELLGFAVSESQIRYIERVTLGVELVGTGRLAAHTADAAMRLIVSLSFGERVVHAEIGVLSGLYAALLARVSDEMGVDTYQVLIDPYEGYYGESDVDALTLSQISAENVRRNLMRVGCDDSKYTLIEGFSEDASTVQKASMKTYDTILVDGDHSYEGVVADIDAYGPLLQPEGLLLLDDYGNPDWPGVTQAVDDLASRRRIEIIAVVSRTAIARFHAGPGEPTGV